VKCDEAFPCCLRCQKSGFTCDGYKPPDEGKLSKRQQRQKKQQDTHFVTIAPLSEWKQARKPASQPRGTLFSTEQEFRYFRVFCDKVSKQFSGYFESPIWSRLVLQAADGNESIRRAIMAVGALGVTLEAGTSKAVTHVETSANMDEHHSFALKQYGLAIKEMRKSFLMYGDDLRTTLLICLLIICFESLHGNHESSIAQIQAGIRILEEWFQRRSQTRFQDGSSSSINSGYFVGFSIQSPVRLCPCFFDSLTTLSVWEQAPDIIEDELVQAFGRLDMQAISFSDCEF
jgi:hypothetical protein